LEIAMNVNDDLTHAARNAARGVASKLKYSDLPQVTKDELVEFVAGNVPSEELIAFWLQHQTPEYLAETIASLGHH
jgi:hypothetical protein